MFEGLLMLPLALPRRLLALAAGRQRSLDGQTLDTQTQLLMRMIAMARQPDTSELEPAVMRSRMHEGVALAGDRRPRLESVAELQIPGPGGELGARLYRPCSGPLGLLVFFHGGGWVAGDLATHDGLCRELAVRANCLVLAIDYRRAPEHPFPAAIDDALAAFRWAQAHASELDAIPSRIAVGGDSAGGNLAAAVSLLTKGQQGPQLQLLLYPVLDASTEAGSYELFATGYLLTRAAMRSFVGHYLPSEEDRRDERASPLLAANLEGVAKAHIVTAGFDVLRDEGEAYAARLEQAGVEVSLRRYASLTHGFLSLAMRIRAAGDALNETASALRRALSPTEFAGKLSTRS